MRFSCTQENLSQCLGLVSRITGRGATLPILNNVLLRTGRSGLELVATNLEVAILTTVRGKVEREGVITVNGRLFSEAAALFPKERVDMEVEGTELRLSCGRYRTMVRGLPADDFPVIPEVPEHGGPTLAAGELSEALTQVLFAINPEESRPEIGGVYVAPHKNGLVVVGTDSYRLAERTVEAKGKLVSGPFIVPLRAAQEVARVAASAAADSDVSITTNETQAQWQIGDTKVISRLVAGQYPDYQQIIPKEFATEVKVEREELLRAVRAASLFVRSGINDIKLSFDAAAKVVEVFSTNSQLGENSIELTPSVLTGQANEIVFNYRYVLEGLQAVSSKEIQLGVVSGQQPSMFRPVGRDNYLYIIMPIRQ